MSISGKKEKCLILLHVPKTAGESLMQFFILHGIRLWTKYGSLAWDEEPGESDRMPGVDFATADVYMGHFTYGFRKYLRRHGMLRACYEATILREPLDRALSALYYHYEGTRGAVRKSDQDFVRMLEQDSRGAPGEWQTSEAEYYNTQCHLLGEEGFASHYDSHFAGAWADVNASFAREVVLSRLDFVGFTDNLSFAADTLALFLGLKAGSYRRPSRANRSRNRGASRASKPLRDLLLQWNRLDLQLYTLARERWLPDAACQGAVQLTPAAEL